MTELRWLETYATAPEFGPGYAKKQMILQYRNWVKGEDTRWRWTEWKDVPTVLVCDVVVTGS